MPSSRRTFVGNRLCSDWAAHFFANGFCAIRLLPSVTAVSTLQSTFIVAFLPLFATAEGLALTNSATARNEVPMEASQSKAPGTKLAASVGDGVLEMLRGAESGLTARLRPIGAEAAETHAQDRARIAGYPRLGPARKLSADQIGMLGRIFVDDRSYEWGARIRCRNEAWIGVRFLRGHEAVDVVVGTACRQTIWSFRRDGRPERWGEIISEAAFNELLRLLGERHE